MRTPATWGVDIFWSSKLNGLLLFGVAASSDGSLPHLNFRVAAYICHSWKALIYHQREQDKHKISSQWGHQHQWRFFVKLVQIERTVVCWCGCIKCQKPTTWEFSRCSFLGVDWYMPFSLAELDSVKVNITDLLRWKASKGPTWTERSLCHIIGLVGARFWVLGSANMPLTLTELNLVTVNNVNLT